MLLVFFYIAFLTHSVLASPLEQDPLESIIIQVLEATRDELGLGNNTIVNESPELHFGWYYSYRTDDLHIIINNYITLEDVIRHHNDCPSLATCDWFSFHGYSARHSPPPDWQFLDPKEHAEFQVDNLLFVINTSSTGNAKSELEVLYRNAVKYGLIPSGEGDASTHITPTVTPHITDTPQPGTTITLTASADNYTAVTNQVDNSTNIGSVLITGLVTDAATGAPISGATVQITGGANPITALTAPDGTYTLTAVVPGGEGNGSVFDLNFALPMSADLTNHVFPTETELLADGLSSTEVHIEVCDLQGEPLPNRDLLLTFPKKHHRSIHSVNPLERLNREIRCRTRVVGVFPNRASVFRLVGTLLMDTDENWRGERRYMAQEGMSKLLNPELAEPSEKSFNLVDELLKLEVQNVIYTT